MKTALESARAYLDKLPAAVSGAGGSNATLAAACWCVRFGLSDTDAMALLRDYSARCTPPWTEKELAHKLAAAHRKTAAKPHRLHLAAPAARVVWKLERKTPPPCPVPPPPAPPAEPPEPEPEPPALALTERHTLRPGDAIPGRLLPVLATWKALRHHPAWAGVQWPKPEPEPPLAALKKAL